MLLHPSWRGGTSRWIATGAARPRDDGGGESGRSRRLGGKGAVSFHAALVRWLQADAANHAEVAGGAFPWIATDAARPRDDDGGGWGRARRLGRKGAVFLHAVLVRWLQADAANPCGGGRRRFPMDRHGRC